MLGNTIGKNLRKLRMEKNMSQTYVAQKLFIQRQTLSAYERGKNTPDIYILMELARIYETSLDELIGNGRKE
ncbi:MAG: helix-turn-helix transcriptional regulator [Ruminococcus sp.]|nr:helix-turn-helix transcriptional regulator [Ruminococcus sp.]